MALVCRPVADRADDVTALIDRVITRVPALLYEWNVLRDQVTHLLEAIASERESPERESWQRLRQRLISASVQRP